MRQAPEHQGASRQAEDAADADFQLQRTTGGATTAASLTC